VLLSTHLRPSGSQREESDCQGNEPAPEGITAPGYARRQPHGSLRTRIGPAIRGAGRTAGEARPRERELQRGSEDCDQCAEWKAHERAVTDTVHFRQDEKDLPLTAFRLTATVVYCACDTILPLQGDREAFSPPAEPQIRQHWNGGTAEASNAGGRRETGGHGGSSRKPAGSFGRRQKGSAQYPDQRSMANLLHLARRCGGRRRDRRLSLTR